MWAISMWSFSSLAFRCVRDWGTYLWSQSPNLAPELSSNPDPSSRTFSPIPNLDSDHEELFPRTPISSRCSRPKPRSSPEPRTPLLAGHRAKSTGNQTDCVPYVYKFAAKKLTYEHVCDSSIDNSFLLWMCYQFPVILILHPVFVRKFYIQKQFSVSEFVIRVVMKFWH